MAEEFDLERFVAAQDANLTYAAALTELVAGTKRSHWMWFVFPQIVGLGRSAIAQRYAIDGLAEASAYLAHPLLALRLCQSTEAMLRWAGRRCAAEILGAVDALKFVSSMTLFECADDTGERPFADALEAFACGRRDHATLALIAKGAR